MEHIKDELFPQATRVLYGLTDENKIRDTEKLFNDGVIKCIDRVFLSHAVSNIESFCLSCIHAQDHLTDNCVYAINNWVTYAVRHNVQLIRLTLIFSKKDIFLPPRLFNSDTLSALYLVFHRMKFRVPCMVHLPKLKTMHITGACICDEKTTYRLLLGSPVLENLHILHCYLDPDLSVVDISSLSLKRLVLESDFTTGSLCINAPKLEYFAYEGNMSKNPTIELPSLTDTSIICGPFNLYRSDKAAVNKILNSVQMTRYLNISLFCFKVLRENFKETAVSPFHCLKQLEIEVESTNQSWEFVIHIVKTNLELQELIVYIDTRYGNDDQTLSMDYLPLGCSSHMENLRSIEMRNFRGGSEFNFLKYLLRTQLRLEKMIIKSDKNWKRGVEASRELFNYPRIAAKLSMLMIT